MKGNLETKTAVIDCRTFCDIIYTHIDLWLQRAYHNTSISWLGWIESLTDGAWKGNGWRNTHSVVPADKTLDKSKFGIKLCLKRTLIWLPKYIRILRIPCSFKYIYLASKRGSLSITTTLAGWGGSTVTTSVIIRHKILISCLKYDCDNCGGMVRFEIWDSVNTPQLPKSDALFRQRTIASWFV